MNNVNHISNVSKSSGTDIVNSDTVTTSGAISQKMNANANKNQHSHNSKQNSQQQKSNKNSHLIKTETKQLKSGVSKKRHGHSHHQHHQQSHHRHNGGRRTRVVKIKRSKGQIIQGCDVYIGRRMTRGGWDLPESKWHCPFTLAKCGSREEILKRYKEYVLSKPDLLDSLHELEDKVLGCWCKPKPCHGDVLVELLRNRANLSTQLEEGAADTPSLSSSSSSSSSSTS